MKIFRKIRGLYHLWTREMPLEELENYDAYWEKRQDDGKSGETGYRNKNHRKLILARELEDGKTLLDIGCGNCSFFDTLKAKNKKIDLTGVEISETAAKEGLRKGYNVRIQNLREERLEGQYDYITALNVFEHMVDPESVIKNVYNSFNDYLIISVPNIGSLTHRIRLAVFGRMPLTSVWFHVKEHIRFWTVKDFHHWADYQNLRIVKEYGISAGGKWKNICPSLFHTNMMYFLKRKS